MKPITVDNLIQDICHECGTGCQILCDKMQFFKNISDRYKIYSLASNLEIAGVSFKIAQQKEASGDFENSTFYYKKAYNDLLSAVKAKENSLTKPEETK
jgi:hypothetical protein